MAEHEVPLEEVNEHIQHHAHDAKEKWIGIVALSTAFLAAFAAISALLSSHNESESMKEHAEEFDQWSYYQAKGIEKTLLENKIELMAVLKGRQDPKEEPAAKKEEEKKDEGKKSEGKAKKKLSDEDKIADYEKKREKAKEEAEHLHKISKIHGDAQKNFALAVTMFQMAIAVGAISILTKRKGFWYVSFFVGVIGIYFLFSGLHILRSIEESAEKPGHETKPDGTHEKAAERNSAAENLARKH